ncbi:formyltetrahydrofolate deformylase [Halobacillus karajensis]|uniref:Formyltetrahydrofolate deformylase n=1 Tax=Halobacillus karajensis TaxID=195088 RepID=A0A024P6X3_9BACI|nr:formyltetrahydrofolate deformylase [Halobacillus karajensis]CDQ20444.1 Formyltetrahydrofolate deformylase [Halobacillus karajensis]CDQ24087.1 Formyltetrahydrofolate deformylase [Halobacillus karajensis]CDQ27565.1 Formyltetrahydrofolate deformylase [Halobacillus karajensis]SEH91579.1 formyltetrahydrofolate deformylase [Halobacillus karajensis]
MLTSTKQQIQHFLTKNEDKARLLVSCPDQPGIVSCISRFLYEHGANIVESNQYTTDHEEGTFFLRIVFASENMKEKEENLKINFHTIAEQFGMTWRMTFLHELKRTAIFVSKELHCLRELLYEWESGNLVTDIPLVISNHETARDIVESFGIPFYYIPANKDIRKEVEEKQLELLEEYDIDLIVLARYMQILTPNFVDRHPSKIINIHHSFLPAFIGANPHKRAYKRGVKLIGATSHYVTDDLDEGPIIEQDVIRVDHRNNVHDLKKKGRLIERSVLNRAVKWDIEDRVLVHKNKTIVL